MQRQGVLMERLTDGQPCPKSPAAVHCDHSIGEGTTHGWAGRDLMQCCYCGRHIVYYWEIQSLQLEGHGDQFKLKTKVYVK
jgi:hypothetical protein